MKIGDWRGDIVSAAAIVAATVNGAQVAAAPPELSPPVECRIDATSSSGLLRLQAIGHSGAKVSGRYQFSISKHNAAGSTANQQSGDFTLAPREDRVIATIMLEAAADGHYSAQLSLHWDGGSVSCHAP
jgi:hypothetical protein